MAVPSSIDPAQYLHEHLSAASPDLLRSMLTAFINTLMPTRSAAPPYGQSSPERTNVRNGYRHREFDTRAGTLEVAIPKLREGAATTRTGCCNGAAVPNGRPLDAGPYTSWPPMRWW